MHGLAGRVCGLGVGGVAGKQVTAAVKSAELGITGRAQRVLRQQATTHSHEWRYGGGRAKELTTSLELLGFKVKVAMLAKSEVEQCRVPTANKTDWLQLSEARPAE